MPRQKTETYRKGSIELSSGNVISESPASPIAIVAAVMLNVSGMVLTPTTSNYALNSQNENIYIEQTNASFVNPYPVMNLKYEDGIIREADSASRSSFDNPKVMDEDTSVDITFQQIIGDLRKENAVLRRRLEKSLPTHTIVYMVGSSVLGAIAATLLTLRVCFNVYTLDPYYLICALITAVGLFLTAFTSLKDWKGNLLK